MLLGVSRAQKRYQHSNRVDQPQTGQEKIFPLDFYHYHYYSEELKVTTRLIYYGGFNYFSIFDPRWGWSSYSAQCGVFVLSKYYWHFRDKIHYYRGGNEV